MTLLVEVPHKLALILSDLQSGGQLDASTARELEKHLQKRYDDGSGAKQGLPPKVLVALQQQLQALDGAPIDNDGLIGELS